MTIAMSKPGPDWRRALAALPPNGIGVLQPAGGPRAARRVARALLEEAAILGGGQVLALPGGDLLLGAAAGPGQRAAQAIARLTGAAPESFSLPAGQAALAARTEAAATAPAFPGWSLAALEAHVAQLPLSETARLTLFTAGAGGAPIAQRLGPTPLGLDDPELEAMAREALCRRLLAALAHPAERGQLPALRPGLRLILDMPQTGLQGGALRAGPPGDPNGPVALLPLAALADGAAFARMAGALREAGWAVGLLAGDAAAPALLDPPDITWAIPAPAEPPPILPARLIALGRPVPGWCHAAGILHEGVA
jgi:hypothetical protein